MFNFYEKLSKIKVRIPTMPQEEIQKYISFFLYITLKKSIKVRVEQSIRGKKKLKNVFIFLEFFNFYISI